MVENPEEDADWYETFLLQVMADEFEVGVEDDSAFEVAEQIVRLRKDCAKGNFQEVQEMKTKWDSKGSNQDIGKLFQKTSNDDDEDEDEDEEDEDEDVDMDEAPELVRVREPTVPEVDEDGFTKVTKKKR